MRHDLELFPDAEKVWKGWQVLDELEIDLGMLLQSCFVGRHPSNSTHNMRSCNPMNAVLYAGQPTTRAAIRELHYIGSFQSWES